MADFVIEGLSHDDIRRAYPLVREAFPAIDLSTWLRFARHLTRPRRRRPCGIIAARLVGRTAPAGLFCYRVEDNLGWGQLLVADHFVAVDMLDPAAVVTVLAEALDGLAKRLGCRAVRSLVHDGATEVERGLQSAGYRQEGVSLLLKANLLETPRGVHHG